MMGMMMSSVRLLVMVENAPPMIVPTASAMALPLIAKVLNSSHQEGFRFFFIWFISFLLYVWAERMSALYYTYFFSMTSMPPRYLRSTSGTTMEPSAR